MKSDTAESIAALIERIGRLISTEAHIDGLLPVQWETLRYLNRANRFSRTPAALTAYLGLTKGTVSQTLNVLEYKGLVKKQANPKDRRSKHLSLTGKAQKLLLRDPLDATIAAIGRLTSASQKTLKKDLRSVLTTRLTSQDRQPFGQCQNCRYFARRHAEGSPHYCALLQEQLMEDDAQAICFEQVPA